MYREQAFLRHGSEQYLACGTAVEKSAPHIAHATLRMRAATFMALLRANVARMRAAWTARFSGSARYRRMYSRIRARLPSSRQGGEQYDSGLPFPPSEGGNAPPQTRHLAARFRARRGAVAATEAEAGAALPRARALFRQGSEQYLAARLDASNALPHPLQPARRARATFLSALSAHREQ